MNTHDPHHEPLVLTAEQQLLIRQAARRLGAEFDGTFNLPTIERYIVDSQNKLGDRARFATWLPVLVERFTRDRLRALARLEVGTPDRPAVLFLCVHNAGRSQMAAAWLRHLAGDGVDVFAGGVAPAVSANHDVVRAMAEVGIDISDHHPQPWTDEMARAADVIVSMGCGDACPVYPGKRYMDWELLDPSNRSFEVIRELRDDIRTRVEALMAELQLTPA